jgi:hypothetical protein
LAITINIFHPESRTPKIAVAKSILLSKGNIPHEKNVGFRAGVNPAPTGDVQFFLDSGIIVYEVNNLCFCVFQRETLYPEWRKIVGCALRTIYALHFVVRSAHPTLYVSQENELLY